MPLRFDHRWKMYLLFTNVPVYTNISWLRKSGHKIKHTHTYIYIFISIYIMGLPMWCSGKESACQCRRCKRHEFYPCVWKVPRGRKWQPTAGFCPEKFHGWRSLAGYRPWASTELDTTEWMSTDMYIYYTVYNAPCDIWWCVAYTYSIDYYIMYTVSYIL